MEGVGVVVDVEVEPGAEAAAEGACAMGHLPLSCVEILAAQQPATLKRLASGWVRPDCIPYISRTDLILIQHQAAQAVRAAQAHLPQFISPAPIKTKSNADSRHSTKLTRTWNGSLTIWKISSDLLPMDRS